MSEQITFSQFDSALKRIEKNNLKRNGRSLSFASMSNQAHGIILEIRTGEKTLLVIPGWRDELKSRFTEEAPND